MVSQGLLDELKVIMEQELGLELSDEQVSNVGNNIIDLYDLLQTIVLENAEDARKTGKQREA